MLIPYGRHHIDEDDVSSVTDILKSDWLTQGPAVPRFEQAISEYCKVKHSVAVNSATSALHIACKSLNLGVGDILWTSPISFVASANCGLYCGADVDFIDIDPISYNISIASLREKLSLAKKDNNLPKVIVVVHYAGQPCEMKEIFGLSQQFGFKIIEDASHAIGASYLGGMVGSCEFSDITVFSFHPVKIITSAEGGCAVTNSDELCNKMRMLRSHGIEYAQEAENKVMIDDEVWNYQQLDLGFNYRLSDLHAALGASQLKKINAWVDKRHSIANKYDEELSHLPIVTPKQSPNVRSSYHLYPIQVDASMCGTTQKNVYEFLRKNMIMVNIHYIPIYLHPFYRQLGFNRGHCKNAEEYFCKTLTLPIYSELSLDRQMFVIENLKRAINF